MQNEEKIKYKQKGYCIMDKLGNKVLCSIGEGERFFLDADKKDIHILTWDTMDDALAFLRIFLENSDRDLKIVKIIKTIEIGEGLF